MYSSKHDPPATSARTLALLIGTLSGAIAGTMIGLTVDNIALWIGIVTVVGFLIGGLVGTILEDGL